MPTRRFPGLYKNLVKISDFVTRVAKEAGFDKSQVYEIQLAVDEASTNIIEHAYKGEGQGEIECSVENTHDGLLLIFRDWGEPFDPDSVAMPDFSVPLEELKFRGAGIFFMRKVMDKIEYQFSEENGNVLTMLKKY